jgi:hypothetical protein
LKTSQIDIDKEGFTLLEILEVKPRPTGEGKQKTEKRMFGMANPIELGEISDLQLESTDGWGGTSSMFQMEGDYAIGFGLQKYANVKSIAIAFLDDDELASKADQSFIEKEIFQWVLNVHKTKKADLNLLAYLEKRVDEELKSYTFYFKLHPLFIETPFEFGPLKVFGFTEDYLQSAYKRLPNDNKVTWENFKLGFNHLLNSIVVELTVKAVRSKAEAIAKNEVALAVNAMKCFLIPESMALHYQIFDLDFKISNGSFTKFLVKDENDERLKITMQRLDGAQPATFNQVFFARLDLADWHLVSNFIRARKKTTFHLLILESIDQFGAVISNRNLHERIVQLISFFELYLNDENSTRSKAETVLKTKILPVLVPKNQVEPFKIKIRHIYHIRDKYLHNRVLLPIDLNELHEVQILAFRFLKLMINHDSKFNSKTDFYIDFDIPH